MDINVKRIIVPAVVSVTVAVALLVARSISFKILQRWADKTETRADDIVIGVIRTPSIYWAVAIGIYIGIAVSDLPSRYVNYLTIVIHILIILSATIVAANLSGRMFSDYVQKLDLPIATTGLAQTVVKGVIIAVGLTIVLGAMGISITPLITALGIGGLAVALALQDTLANMFAGLHILAEKSIRVGDVIRLESGQEGRVDDITWRTTRVRMLQNNMVIIPNSKLSQSIVTNYSLPDKNMSVSIRVSAGYSSDPEKIERVLVGLAKKAVGEIQGLLEHPEPSVRFIPGFGESSLDFTLNCQVSEFADQYLVQHELRKRIFKMFRDEGIEMPFPSRTVYVREEKG